MSKRLFTVLEATLIQYHHQNQKSKENHHEKKQDSWLPCDVLPIWLITSNLRPKNKFPKQRSYVSMVQWKNPVHDGISSDYYMYIYSSLIQTQIIPNAVISSHKKISIAFESFKPEENRLQCLFQRAHLPKINLSRYAATNHVNTITRTCEWYDWLYWILPFDLNLWFHFSEMNYSTSELMNRLRPILINIIHPQYGLYEPHKIEILLTNQMITTEIYRH